MRTAIRPLAGLLLGAATALAIVACGGSGKGLIPVADAGPLQGDFEAVAQAAQSGGGDCTATKAALEKTEHDFAALPASVDAALHAKLDEGIANLRERALALCAQPLTQTNTATTSTSTSRTTTPTHTETTPVTPAPTTSTRTTATTPAAPATPPNAGGGTVAPNGGASPESGESPEGQESGNHVGEAGGQEAGK
ncbi:MAG TPA: hypothetical protein VL972_01285 [Solirubrobacteraceae bacterium]|nr:hypothetical protein [Solirubrobacteraceae bacterium]